MRILLTLLYLTTSFVIGDDGVQYSFQYRVLDQYSGQDFGQEETRAGYNTAGEYEVQLPDGRRQIVTYSVKDPTSGYIADVHYQGEATYAETGIPLKVHQSPVLPSSPPIRTKPTIASGVTIPRTGKSSSIPRPSYNKPIHKYRELPSVPAPFLPSLPTRPPSLPSRAVSLKIRPSRILSRPVSTRPSKPVQTIRVARPTTTLPARPTPTRPARPTPTRTARPTPTLPVRPTPTRPVRPNPTRNVRPTRPAVSLPAKTLKRRPTPVRRRPAPKQTSSAKRPSPTPAVYIASREPKTAEYKDILHPAESRMLGSLFREDIKGKMTPPARSGEKN